MGKLREKIKSFKEAMKGHKKRVAIISTITVSILAIVVLVLTTVFQTASKKKKETVLDPELAKAMTYDQVQEGDEAVNGTPNVKRCV